MKVTLKKARLKNADNNHYDEDISPSVNVNKKARKPFNIRFLLAIRSTSNVCGILTNYIVLPFYYNHYCK